MKNCIVYFVKIPEIINIKTKLTAFMDNKKAYLLHKSFLIDAINMIDKIPVKLFIYFTPEDKLFKLKTLLKKKYTYMLQKGNNLGERIINATTDLIDDNFEKIIIITSDIPNITKEILDEALFCLDHNDIVIGPSADGGYYLIGFNKNSFDKKNFSEIKWNTEKVLQSTIEKIILNKKRFAILPELREINTFNDIEEFYIKNSLINNSETLRTIKKIKIL